ncbi:hypothetical protein GCM10009122_49140 [Fulvivirga kasyanovii]|uniref:Tetratricopeptide repeat protein n=1 Tax=Fulvivirga kasyanovii TaxID=396812 RepID=A0ABW9RKI3_9BACT|nr:DUF6340 family protein [Fulvivirga kasyanovii]MTI24599.1 hypothetical protein [Fulvivirga kasyanovii]
MKKSTARYFIALSLLAVMLLGACSGTRIVTMNAMRPAEITFPSYANTIVIVDRSRFDKNAVNIVEGILTGEMPGEDKAGVQATITAFQNQLMASPRFQTKVASEQLTGNSITSAFPAPLPWPKVEQILSKYGGEVMVAIEMFDTDFVVTNGKRKVKKQIEQDGVKKEIEVDEFYAEGVGNLTIGFRVYDPKEKTIVDQQLISKSNTWQAAGKSAKDALAGLIAKSDATRYMGKMAGSDYAYKIAPMPIRISREFYSKSKKVPEIAAGSRMADVNDWQGAAKKWESGISRAGVKEAGYLCYNIAISYEVMGDLNTAKSWADRAYVDYGNKKAREYSATLNRRMYQEQRVQKQMK